MGGGSGRNGWEWLLSANNNTFHRFGKTCQRGRILGRAARYARSSSWPGTLEAEAAGSVAACCCWSPIIVPMHADRSPLLSTCIPASEKHCLFKLQHSKRRSVFFCSRLTKQQRRRFHCEKRVPRARNVVWRRFGCSRPARATEIRSMGVLACPSGTGALHAHVEAHGCGSARAWSLKRACYRVVMYVWTEKRGVWWLSRPWAEISLSPLKVPDLSLRPSHVDTALKNRPLHFPP